MASVSYGIVSMFPYCYQCLFSLSSVYNVLSHLSSVDYEPMSSVYIEPVSTVLCLENQCHMACV